MSQIVASKFELYPWQKVVIDFAGQYHTDLLSSDFMDSLSDYERSKESSIKVSLPRGAGHTLLAAYLATHSPCVLIYESTNHYKELESYANSFTEHFVENQSNIGTLGFHKDTHVVSSFELYHDMLMADDVSIESLKEKFGKHQIGRSKLTIVDQAEALRDRHPEVVDWLFHLSTGPVVLLG